MPKKQNQKISGKIHISEKFVCLALTVRSFTNRKAIKDVAEDGVRSALVVVRADPRRVSASKTLIVSPELDAINTHTGQTKKWLNGRCLSSIFKGGLYILPNELIESVDQYLIGALAEYQILVECAVSAYPQRKEEAKEALRLTLGADVAESMYQEADYPSEAEFRSQFDLSWRYLSFDVPESLQNIRTSLYEREARKASEQWAVLNDEVTGLLRASMAGLVEHMVASLTPGADGKRKRFHDTLTENFNDFIRTFEARNISDDKELAELVKQARRLMAGIEPDLLRESESIRDRLKTGMEEIKTSLSSLIETQPSRSYNFDE